MDTTEYNPNPQFIMAHATTSNLNNFKMIKATRLKII
jgi:hypothetical protein